MEIRNYGEGAVAEVFIGYPHPLVRLVDFVPSYLHRDALGSVIGTSGTDGLWDDRAVYRPFGEQIETLRDPTATPEAKGFIGERYDADAGLQYLNARYYDPKLGLFIQPDWFEVTKAGVGTNRFSYSFNDPVNKFDHSGNETTGGGAANPSGAELDREAFLKANASDGWEKGKAVYVRDPDGKLQKLVPDVQRC
jgi:RHS repeat-associated protein